MTAIHLSIRHVLTAAALALGVLGAAALSGTAVGAQPAPLRPIPASVAQPSLGPLKVQAFGTRAVISFTSSEPTALAVEYRPAGAMTPPSPTPRGPLGGVANPLGTGGVATTGETPPPTAYTTQHQFELKPLKSNTTYHVFVSATTRSGQQLRAETAVRTHPRRLRVTLSEINIEHDGDGYLRGKGEPVWFVDLAWAGGRADGSFPDTNVAFGEGRFVPRTSRGLVPSWTFAEENFDTLPDVLTVITSSDEDDGPIDCFPGCPFDPRALTQREWRVPQGVESASTSVQIQEDGSDLESVVTLTFELFHDDLSYPAPRRNTPRSTW
jgi:hypothetical protein